MSARGRTVRLSALVSQELGLGSSGSIANRSETQDKRCDLLCDSCSHKAMVKDDGARRPNVDAPELSANERAVLKIRVLVAKLIPYSSSLIPCSRNLVTKWSFLPLLWRFRSSMINEFDEDESKEDDYLHDHVGEQSAPVSGACVGGKKNVPASAPVLTRIGPYRLPWRVCNAVGRMSVSSEKRWRKGVGARVAMKSAPYLADGLVRGMA
ncbi:hypothetical protein U1Q18_052168 [Sarracenia purpurea var. burkii]